MELTEYRSRNSTHLAKHGIHLICLEHLPRTYLDGAALQLTDRTPVVGLTLRYDRLDNFWFCLLHELAHVGRHLAEFQGDGFGRRIRVVCLDGDDAAHKASIRSDTVESWCLDLSTVRLDCG
jgi:hypothetical protein